MPGKKTKIKKRKPIERVYKDGREAIVKAVKSRVKNKKPAILTPVTASQESLCTIQERKAGSKPITINDYGLPTYSATTRITLIVKDPFWIYAYWEIADSSVEDVKRQLGGNLDGARFVVRMYDVTYKDFNGFNANHWFDVEVGRHSNNWYISIWNDNTSYLGEIGIAHHSGRFFPMARSNFVHTPRSGSSNRFEEIWMDLAQKKNIPNAAVSRPKDDNRTYGAARSEPSRGIQYDAAGRFSYSSVSKKRKIFLTESDLKAYYSRLSPSLRDMMFSRISRKRLYRYLYSGMSGKEWHDLLYFKRLHNAQFGRKVMIGASEFTYLGASENLQGGSSGFVQPDKKHT